MPAHRPANDRFWEKVDTTGDCWVWTAATNGKGYGRFCPTRDEPVLAHRWSYEQANGPIPTGMHLDHLCRVRLCVRPDHLEPVSVAENNRRQKATITSCPKGHAYSGDNLYVRPNGRGRDCRECKREANRKWRATNAPAYKRGTSASHPLS